MGRYVFKLPDVGEGTAEAEIVAWHVKIGDTIEEDQNLVDVMTDKATVEMTSPVSGKVISLHGEPGQMAAVGSALVELEVEGAGNAAGNGAAKPAPTPKEKKDSLAPGGGEGRGEGASAPTHSEPPKTLREPPHPSPLPLRGRENLFSRLINKRK
jgi:2-oxoisovalerate dehydrogenase E2 component (dihydrolipoyl transacylase)